MENPERTSFLPLVERTEWSTAESRDACAAMNRWTDAVEKFGTSLVWRRPVTDPTVRVAIKDVLDVTGMPTSYGLKAGKREAADSTVTAAQGFPEQTMVGKAATTELGIGLEHGCVNLAYPHVDPGGSSTGSAVAVATGVCDVALGTDSVASVRIPAAATGIVGLRTSGPSSTLMPGFSLSDRLDAPGWFARTPADLAFAWERWIQPGQRISPEIEGVQFEIIEEAVAGVLDVEMAHAVNEASDALTRSGAACREASIGELFAARRLAYEACVADARVSVEKFSWVKDFLSDSTARALGTDLTLTALELSARLVELRSAARSVLEDGRIWLLPAGAQLPLDLRIETLPDSTIPAEHSGSISAPINYFAAAAMLRLPSISIPLGTDQRDLPMSVQLIGGPGSDALLVSMAWAISNRLGTPDLGSKCLENLGTL